MTTAVQPRITEAQLERAICARSFQRFLPHVRIQEPPVPGVPGSGGIIPFLLWPHLMEFAALLCSAPLVALLKARQVGATWLIAAYLAWLVIYRPGSDWLLLSRTEIDAVDFLFRVKAVLRLLPPHLAVPIQKESALSLLLANGSRLTAMASTEDAGRGHTYSGVAQDEADFHPYLSENFSAVKPTIDAGGQLLMVSTVNKRRMDSLFKGLLRGAPQNGWRTLFFPWSARPGRDQAWYEATKAATPPSLGMSPELYMEQEYPGSEAEAMAPSRAMAYFDPDALAAMYLDCREPEMRQGGLIRIWRKPVVAARYIGGGDVCWGHSSAYSCFPIADARTGVQMAEVYGRPEHDEYAKAIADLTTEYNKAYFGVEANGETTERSGLNVINKLIDLGLGDRMYHHGPNWRKDETSRGCLTTGATRPKILGELAEAVRLHQVTLLCRDGVSEFLSFIRNEKGRAEASVGAKSDHVMAWAWLWEMRHHASFGGQGKPVYLDAGWR